MAGRRRPAAGPGGTVRAAASVQVPGSIQVTAGATSAQNSEVTGFIVLTKGSDTRRVPFWGHIEAPRLPRQKHRALKKTGITPETHEDTRLVDSYRYLENPTGVGIPAILNGPEQVFTVRLSRLVANFGVAILKEGRGVSIQPRVVADNDENRLTGYPALPFNLNPYVTDFYKLTPVSGAILPARPVRRRLRLREQPRRGQVHVPLLDQRRDTSGGAAADALGRPRSARSACASPTRVPASIRPRSLPRSTATPFGLPIRARRTA